MQRIGWWLTGAGALVLLVLLAGRWVFSILFGPMITSDYDGPVVPPVARVVLARPAGATGAAVTGIVRVPAGTIQPDCVALIIHLEDVTLADASASVVAMQEIEAPRADSYPFVLAYDPATLDPSHHYSLSVVIDDATRPLLRTTQAYPVLTRGHDTNAGIIDVQPIVP